MKPIPVNKFRRVLTYWGLELKRRKGSHEIWDYPNDSLNRPVTLVSNLADLPVAHIKSNLRTLNKSIKEYEEALKSC